MGCDFYVQEHIDVELKDGSVVRSSIECPQRRWFPDDLFRHTDMSDNKEVDDVTNKFIDNYPRGEEVVWILGQELRSLYTRVLRDHKVDIASVACIVRRTSAWLRT